MRFLMVLWLGISLTTFATEFSEVNRFAESYQAKNTPNAALTPDPEGPKMYSGNVREEDYQKMLNSGFDYLGYSNFEATDTPPEDALTHAKTIKADVVLVYTERKGKAPLSVKINQMKEAANSENKTMPKDTAYYSYFASYWVRLAPPLLGLHVKASDEGAAEKGLEVLAVMRNSPAEKAGFRVGDVLTKLGDISLEKPELLGQTVKKYAGKTVHYLVNRDGALVNSEVTLGAAR